MMDWLTAPLQYDFMQMALVIAIVVAIPTALLSCLLVLKGWALLGDAIAHGVFPGVVLAYVAGWPLVLGAFIAGMLCALFSGFLHNNSRIKQDTAMGVVFSGMFALGLLIYAWVPSDVHLDHILFGDMLGVQWRDVGESALIALVVAGAIALKWRELLLYAFDPIQAHTSGLPVRLLHYGLLAAVSLAVVGALSAVGLVLSIALLIAPGAIAFLIVRSFGRMLWLATGISVMASVLGVLLSFHLDSAPGPTIVLLLTLCFIAVFVWRVVQQKLASERPAKQSLKA